MHDKPELPNQKDMPMAYRAIALAEGLSGDAKRVAAIILGHFNTKTGQCDPGTERLMAKAKVSKRTVVNATNELDRLGLIVKIRHGGNGFRSRYQPNWSLFRKIVAAEESDDNGDEIVQNGAPTQCKSVHLDSANPCTLTQYRNSNKKLKGSPGAGGRVDPARSARTGKPVSADTLHGLLSGSVRPALFRKSPLSVVSAQADAWTEINRWLLALSPSTRDAIDTIWSADVQQAAIVAEQKTRGAGSHLIMDRVAKLAPTAGTH